jgi:hypothetical protein
MGLIAVSDWHAIWPMKEGQLLVRLQSDARHTPLGFVSAAAIRAMLQQGWLERDRLSLRVTEAGRKAARRDFRGAFKAPRRRKPLDSSGDRLISLTIVAPFVIPGPIDWPQTVQ